MTTSLQVGDEVVVEVGPVAHGGHCVARHEGQVLFVRHALPQERVLARVTEIGGGARFVRADAIAVEDASPRRRPAPCRYAGPGGCGGCDWQHADPAFQRELKARVVAEQLTRLAGVTWPVQVEPVPGDRDGLRWRTRVRLAVDPSGRAGLRRHRSHDVVPVDDCLLADERMAASGALTRPWEPSGAVDVVTPGDGSAAVVVPWRRGRPAPQVHEPVATNRWSGSFALAATGFWQVHPGAAATYLAAVLEALDPQPGDRVLDLYAGAGLFALPLADLVGRSGRVDAVEQDRQAVADGIRNATGRPWLRFHRGSAELILARLQRGCDLVVLDPPRTGAGAAVLRRLVGMRPRTVVYVACDPAALARDTATLARWGYQLVALRAFDAFPMTHHVECVATFRPAARAEGAGPGSGPDEAGPDEVGPDDVGSDGPGPDRDGPDADSGPAV